MTQFSLDGKGLISALAATALWSTVGILIRWLPGWSSFAILAGRFFIATAVMLPIFLLSPQAQRHLTRALGTPLTWWLSLPAIGAAILGTTAFQMAPVGEVALLFTTSPLFIIAYKSVVRSPIQRGESVGLSLSMAGVGLVMLPQLSSAQNASWQTLVGYVLALGAAGLMALYSACFNTRVNQVHAPQSIAVIFVTFLLGSLLSLLGAILFAHRFSGGTLDSQDILVLLGLGIVSTALPFWFYTVAVQRLPVVLTTAMLLLEPVFAVLFAAISLREIPSPWFGVGSILVCCGLLSIASSTHSCKTPSPP